MLGNAGTEMMVDLPKAFNNASHISMGIVDGGGCCSGFYLFELTFITGTAVLPQPTVEIDTTIGVRKDESHLSLHPRRPLR